ncbi:hypothetical protein [Pseudokineococcus sp. 1T1Z-3]|uniref:hypothetical protein n=1 Tax=Pseudokineococcus sp. 1T1Z-3 TaxID=3132745 RepID=UPI00309B304F
MVDEGAQRERVTGDVRLDLDGFPRRWARPMQRVQLVVGVLVALVGLVALVLLAVEASGAGALGLVAGGSQLLLGGLLVVLSRMDHVLLEASGYRERRGLRGGAPRPWAEVSEVRAPGVHHRYGEILPTATGRRTIRLGGMTRQQGLDLQRRLDEARERAGQAP